MKRTNQIVVLSAVLVFAVVACLCGSSGTPAQPTLAVPQATWSGTSAPAQYTLVRLHKGDGTLPNLMKVQAMAARSAGRHPYAELDATWCPPCQAISKTLADGEPRMVDAFAGTTILQIDVDDWTADLAGASLDGSSIPIYYDLGQDGKPTGRTINGAAWGDNIPENMAPPLKAFFLAASK